MLANVLAIMSLVGYLLTQAYPSTEAVRLRNALVFDAGAQAEFDWTPAQVPNDFLIESRQPFPEFVLAAKRFAGDPTLGDWARALALAAMLTRNASQPGGLQTDLVRTYRGIVENGRGYCADYVDAFLALAHAAGLSARSWAFSFDGFGGHGHALVEVFDHSRGKWLFLDVFNNVYAIDARTGDPISALEFRDFALGRREAPVINSIGPSALTWPVEGKLLDYYRRGADEWYLWWGNSKYSYDAHPVVKVTSKVSYSLGQLAAIAVGVHPRIKAIATPQNDQKIQRMLRLRWTLWSLFFALTALCAILVWQIASMRSRARLSHPQGLVSV